MTNDLGFHRSFGYKSADRAFAYIVDQLSTCIQLPRHERPGFQFNLSGLPEEDLKRANQELYGALCHMEGVAEQFVMENYRARIATKRNTAKAYITRGRCPRSGRIIFTPHIIGEDISAAAFSKVALSEDQRLSEQWPPECGTCTEIDGTKTYHRTTQSSVRYVSRALYPKFLAEAKTREQIPQLNAIMNHKLLQLVERGASIDEIHNTTSSFAKVLHKYQLEHKAAKEDLATTVDAHHHDVLFVSNRFKDDDRLAQKLAWHAIDRVLKLGLTATVKDLAGCRIVVKEGIDLIEETLRVQHAVTKRYGPDAVLDREIVDKPGHQSHKIWFTYGKPAVIIATQIMTHPMHVNDQQDHASYAERREKAIDDVVREENIPLHGLLAQIESILNLPQIGPQDGILT